jgi:hypothetical protein
MPWPYKATCRRRSTTIDDHSRFANGSPPAILRALNFNETFRWAMTVGNLLVKQGKVHEAIAELQAPLVIAERLAAADPTNAEWQRDLYASYRNLGLVQERRGNSGEARDMYCRAKSVILTNSALPSGEMEWRQRLDWVEQRAGPGC